MPGLKFTADSVVCFVYVNYFRFIRSAPSGRADAARLAPGRVIVLGPREAELSGRNQPAVHIYSDLKNHFSMNISYSSALGEP